MWRSRSTRSAWCFVCSVISAGAATGAPATTADAGELVEARGDIVGRFGGSLELIVQVLRRFVPDMQDLFAQLERQLGEGDVQAAPRPCIPSRAARPPLAPAPGRPCQRAGAGPAPRRSLRGMEILAGIRLDELRTLCDACLLRLQAMFGDVQAESALNPGAVASPAKDSGGPGARLHPLRPVGRITPWALSADTPEARPGLERHPLPVVQCLQASRSRSWALSRA